LTSPAGSPRALLRAIAAAATLLAVGAPAARATEPETANFDARSERTATPPGERARESLRKRLGRFGALSLDEHSGTVRSVGRLDGFLTGPSGRDGGAVALGYVRDHADAFGLDANDLDDLRLIDRQFVAGIEHLRWEQRYRGIPAADSGLQAAVTGSGRLLNITGPPAADLAVRSIEPSVSASDAYAVARASGGDPSPDVSVDRRDAGGAERATRFADGGRASLTLYRADAGYRLAWRILAPVSSTGVYDVLVDARSGSTVRRSNRVNFAVPAKVFRYTPGYQAQQSEDFAPWLTSSSALDGPNAHAFIDEHDVVGPQESGGYQLTPEAGSDIPPQQPSGGYEYPLSAVSHFSTPFDDGCPATITTMPTSACTWDPRTAAQGNPDPVGRSWRVNRAQSATQLFYFVNTFHDYLRDDPDIAFTDRGFRRNPGKPLGDPNTAAAPDASDPVLAQALDGADTASGLPDGDHVNNSNFLTLPDGYPGLMQMYLHQPPFGGYDGANDASVVFHEYTHGLSNRLITDSAGFGALNSAQAGAMGEGWSDFYALDYLVARGLQTDASGTPDVRFARYLDNATGELMRYQSIDCDASSTSPSPACRAAPGSAGAGAFTYADFGKIEAGPEVHADGEIWGQTLWSMRAALIARYPTGGVARSRRYITQAMRLSPPEPSFLDMRNAILEASPDEDDDLIWQVFAARGMGYFASTDGSRDLAPVADGSLPPAGTDPTGVLQGTVEDEGGQPLSNAHVGIAGHDTTSDTGLGAELADETDANGSYSITAPAGVYPLVRARRDGFRDGHNASSVSITAGGHTTQNLTLEYDWASASHGATVERFSGSDNTAVGCGPDGLIDDDPGAVWGSDSDAGGQTIVIDLKAPIDIAKVAIDPGAGCGDDSSAGLRGYEVSGSTAPDRDFRALGGGAFAANLGGFVRDVPGSAAPAIRYLQLHAATPQNNTGSGANYLDVAELHVVRQPGTVIGPSVETGESQGATTSGATLTGTVTPNQAITDVVFEYGTTTGYGSTVTATTLGAAAAATPVSAAVGGLQPSTTYHFRAVGRRGTQAYPGGDATFTTGPAPTPTPTPTATPTPQPPKATPTVFDLKKLTASRKGVFKVKVRFGSTAPSGNARLRVLVGKRRFAEGRFAVRQSRTVTKTLTLNAKGRKAIKPGKSRKVTLELRLPNGQKLKKSVTLARRKR
jgi:extracellular elastinolytic metalloproteinase